MRKISIPEEIYSIYQNSENASLIQFHLCGTTFPDAQYQIVRNRSWVACIEYVESGSGTVRLDKKIFHPTAGDSYFLPLGKDHHYYSDSKTPWKKHFINISGDLLSSLAESYGLDNVAHFRGLNLQDELLRMIAVAKSAQEDCTPQLVAILNEIFFKMHSHMQKKSSVEDIHVKMKDYLNKQVVQKFNLSLLCAHVGKSESQVIRMFKEAYGVTPYQYLLNKKIELARKLLTDTNLTVQEISGKLCFTDEYYFSNIFKEKTGISPSKYRKRDLHP